MRNRISLVVIATLMLAGAARADEVGTAKGHYQAATAHFAIGEFDEAAKEYEAAYKLRQDPALLFNAAQSHRLAGHHKKALILYKNYLRLYPKLSNAEEVREQLLKLNEAIQADESAKSAPPTSTNEPAQPIPDDKPAQTDKAPDAKQPENPPVANNQATTPPPPEKTPVYKKWWLWTIVGGVVVVAGAVTLGVLLTRPSPSWSNVPDIGPRSSGGLTIELGR